MVTEENPNTPAKSTPEAAQSGTASTTSLPLPEPSKDTTATTLDMGSGQGVKLDHLGPMVVNKDGTLSRIANWEQMSDIERRNTLRILGKRNQLRMNALRNEGEAEKGTQ